MTLEERTAYLCKALDLNLPPEKQRILLASLVAVELNQSVTWVHAVREFVNAVGDMGVDFGETKRVREAHEAVRQLLLKVQV